MPFTPHQHQLLLRSCYGDPQLAEYLERILVEGPGPYDWPPAPGYYEGEQIPLWERISAQIWHQGDIYPATYVAVPVLCEVVVRFPGRNHATLFSILTMIERSRPRFEAQINPYLQETDLTEYHGALKGLLPHLPAQLQMQDDNTQGGFQAAKTILQLIAFACGQAWLGMLVGQSVPLTREQADLVRDGSGNEFRDELLSANVLSAAFCLQRDDLPQSLRAEHPAYQAHLGRLTQEPPQNSDF